MSEAPQPGPLADSDIYILNEWLIETAVNSVLYGIYSVLMMIVLYKFWNNKVQLAAHRILITAVIIMFVASTTQIFMDLAFYLIQLLTAGFNPPNVERPVISMNILSDAMIRLNYLIGDSIVVWRAWVLWTNHIKVHTLLCICLFGTFVGASVNLALAILYDLSQFSDSPRFPPVGPACALILILPLLRTNFISTSLMGYKVWEYKVEIKQNLGLSQNKRTKVERVLILLIESGSIYCLLWAIYPILIVLLLALEKANLELTINGPSFSQALQFASSPQAHTATYSDDIPLDFMTSHINAVMPNSGTDDALDPTMDAKMILQQ
ncbi:hypothetical protein C8J56DRAFT_1131756 [Mycena floridula]|nr:hypothetical protein C8J56DRAFT_1131756 [Mycena floridula]